MQNLLNTCLYKQKCAIKNNIKKHIIILCANIIMLLILFMNLEEGHVYGDAYRVVLLEYIIIWCAMMSFSLMNDVIIESNSQDVAEQIFKSLYSLDSYIFIQVLCKCIYSIFLVAAMTIILNIYINLFSIRMIISYIITLAIGMISMVGLGYMISGISIILKSRIAAVGLKIYFLYLIIGTDEYILLPFSKCKVLLLDLFTRGQCMWQHSIVDFILMCANSIVYLVIGFYLFYKVALVKLKSDY